MNSALSLGIEIVGDGLGPDSDGFARGVAGLARRLEAAGVHYWVLGADRDKPAAPADSPNISLDPSLLATVAARHSTDLGLVVAASAHRDHPYNLARRLLSVDHAARGRVGWFALDDDRRIGLDAAADVWTGGVLGPPHTAEAITAVRTLWRTWPLESIVGDLGSGVFADTSLIRRADIESSNYSITGPLNVPGSVQGDLPVWQHAGAVTQLADLVVVEDGDPTPSGAVIRVRHTDGFDARLDSIAADSGANGVLVRASANTLEPLLTEALPAARRRGVVAPPGTGTLRRRLGLPVPAAPDLSENRLAFDGAPNPGGRL